MNREFWHITNSNQLDSLIEHLRSREFGEFGFQVQVNIGKRTNKQNAAIHVFFALLAKELNESGLDMKRVLKEETDIPWTSDLVKEYLWKPIQKAALDTTSTTKLDRIQVSHVYDILTRHLGQKFGISVPFPSNR